MPFSIGITNFPSYFYLLHWCARVYCNNIFGFIFSLVQDTHNQAGIAHNGGLVPLLKLLDSKNGSLQHNAAFALYGLADNEV